MSSEKKEKKQHKMNFNIKEKLKKTFSKEHLKEVFTGEEQKKHLKQGSYSSMMTVIVLAVIVVINLIVAQMLFLEAENPEKDIYLYINSPGGVITAGMSIYDTMQFIKPDVSTICMGQAASMGAFLLTAGAKGKRFCLPNSRVMIHQPLGGYQGQATDIEIHAREILKVKGRMNELMALHTGQSLEQIERDTERDRFLSAPEAVEYGLVDSILTHRN